MQRVRNQAWSDATGNGDHANDVVKIAGVDSASEEVRGDREFVLEKCSGKTNGIARVGLYQSASSVATASTAPGRPSTS